MGRGEGLRTTEIPLSKDIALTAAVLHQMDIGTLFWSTGIQLKRAMERKGGYRSLVMDEVTIGSFGLRVLFRELEERFRAGWQNFAVLERV